MLSSAVSNTQQPEFNFKPTGSHLNQGHTKGYLSPMSSVHQNESLFDQ